MNRLQISHRILKIDMITKKRRSREIGRPTLFSIVSPAFGLLSAIQPGILLNLIIVEARHKIYIRSN